MNKKEYNLLLDILRIVATAMVFSVHIVKNINMPEGRIFDLINSLCSKGANGVPILFCLSGYLISSGIQEKPFPYAKYIKKRIWRLIPAYWSVLVLYLLFGILPISLGVLRYFTFTNAIIPSKNFNIYNNMGGFWSMSSFMLFYLIAPIINKYIRNLKQAVGGFLICFVVGKLFDFVLEFFLVSASADEVGFMMASFPVGNMYFFLLGVVAYWVIKEKKEFLSLLAALCGIIALIGIDKNDYPLWTLFAFMVIIISSNLVLAFHSNALNVGIRYVSLISYEVYLLHFLFIKLNLMLKICENNGIFLFVTLCVTETIGVSCILHFLIEKCMKNKLTKRCK